MSIRRLKKEAEEVVEIKDIVDVFLDKWCIKASDSGKSFAVLQKLSSSSIIKLDLLLSQFKRMLDYIVNRHFILEHIQDLSHSLLELKIAVFRKEYRNIHRLLIKFTSKQQTSIKEVKGEVIDFEILVGDLVKKYEEIVYFSDGEGIGSCFKRKAHKLFFIELENLLKSYKHLLGDVEKLFNKIHKELEGSDVGFDEVKEI